MDTLIARHQIENLYYRYANSIDEGDFATTAALFEQGALFDADGVVLARGAEQVLSFYQFLIKIYPSTNTPQTQHVISNVLLQDEQQGIINCTANYSVFQKTEQGQVDAIICGQYRSSFKHHNGECFFHEHHMHPRIIGDLSQHLNVSLSDIKQ